MEVRDTEDGHSESASLDLSLSFRWVEVIGVYVYCRPTEAEGVTDEAGAGVKLCK
jgi:hypothetical protein